MVHIPASSLRTQARKLMVKTITEAKLTRPAVLVVDAVDEAGTPEMREPLLEAIAEEFSNLPDSIKVIITSRDEYDLRTSLEGCSDEIRIENTEKTEEDIASYIQYRFTKCETGPAFLQTGLPLRFCKHSILMQSVFSYGRHLPAISLIAATTTFGD